MAGQEIWNALQSFLLWRAAEGALSRITSLVLSFATEPDPKARLRRALKVHYLRSAVIHSVAFERIPNAVTDASTPIDF